MFGEAHILGFKNAIDFMKKHTEFFCQSSGHSGRTAFVYYGQEQDSISNIRRDEFFMYKILSMEWWNLVGVISQQELISLKGSSKKDESNSKDRSNDVATELTREVPFLISSVHNATASPDGVGFYCSEGDQTNVLLSENNLLQNAYCMMTKLLMKKGLTNDNIRFRSDEQALLLVKAATTLENIVVKMPTGSGK